MIITVIQIEAMVLFASVFTVILTSYHYKFFILQMYSVSTNSPVIEISFLAIISDAFTWMSLSKMMVMFLVIHLK